MTDATPKRRKWWPGILVLAVVAALAWWVFRPPYADFPERSRVGEAAAAAAACKTSVAEFVQQRGAYPASAKEAGCFEGPTRYTAGLRVSGGRIEVTIRTGHPYPDGRILTFEATRDEAGTARAGPAEAIAGWRCGTNAAIEAYKYFPANCRQAPLAP